MFGTKICSFLHKSFPNQSFASHCVNPRGFCQKLKRGSWCEAGLKTLWSNTASCFHFSLHTVWLNARRTAVQLIKTLDLTNATWPTFKGDSLLLINFMRSGLNRRVVIKAWGITWVDDARVTLVDGVAAARDSVAHLRSLEGALTADHIVFTAASAHHVPLWTRTVIPVI